MPIPRPRSSSRDAAPEAAELSPPPHHHAPHERPHHEHHRGESRAEAELVEFERHAAAVHDAFVALESAQRVDSLVQVLPIFMGHSSVEELGGAGEDADDDDATVELLHSIFTTWDIDNSGALSAAELMVVFEKLKMNITPKQAMRMIKECHVGETDGAAAAPHHHGELEVDFAQFRVLVRRKPRDRGRAGAIYVSARRDKRAPPPPPPPPHPAGGRARRGRGGARLPPAAHGPARRRRRARRRDRRRRPEGLGSRAAAPTRGRSR